MDMRYRYQGPLSAVTLAGGRDVLLSPGAEVTLPDDNAYVKALVARKHLTRLGPVAATTTVTTATATASASAATASTTTTSAGAASSGTASTGTTATGAANGS